MKRKIAPCDDLGYGAARSDHTRAGDRPVDVQGEEPGRAQGDLQVDRRGLIRREERQGRTGARDQPRECTRALPPLQDARQIGP